MVTCRALFCAFAGAVLMFSAATHAEEGKIPQDTVTFMLSSEDWITAKTARVVIGVEAAVSGASAGTARAEMMKAVDSVAKADWRLTGFSRAQDQTGLERWSASYEARLQESALGGLHESAKKSGKAGMQLNVATIDFSPTLDETETARAGLRSKIYKSAAEQLTILNGAIPNRNYRIAEIAFMEMAGQNIYAMNEGMMGKRLMSATPADAAMMSSSGGGASMERSEKISVSAMVVLAASPQAVADRESKR